MAVLFVMYVTEHILVLLFEPFEPRFDGGASRLAGHFHRVLGLPFVPLDHRYFVLRAADPLPRPLKGSINVIEPAHVCRLNLRVRLFHRRHLASVPLENRLGLGGESAAVASCRAQEPEAFLKLVRMRSLHRLLLRGRAAVRSHPSSLGGFDGFGVLPVDSGEGRVAGGQRCDARLLELTLVGVLNAGEFCVRLWVGGSGVCVYVYMCMCVCEGSTAVGR